MRTYTHSSSAKSRPALPDTSMHPMWKCWDLAADYCLAQLEKYHLQVKNKAYGICVLIIYTCRHTDVSIHTNAYSCIHINIQGTAFKPSFFFEEQLTGFEVWLQFADTNHSPPMQLPVVLQVLLSQGHRLRALQLLARFLDKGMTQRLIWHANVYVVSRECGYANMLIEISSC